MNALNIAPSWLPAWAARLIILTRWEYLADFAITPLITLVLAGWSLTHGATWAWPLGVLGGVLAWTLYEYATHRWLFHMLPPFTELHRMHHRHQREYVALHPLVTLAITVASWLVLGVRASSVVIGFYLGYLTYVSIHTAFHHARITTGSWLYEARRRHVLHHRLDRAWYGVSTPLWDHVFGTTERACAR